MSPKGDSDVLMEHVITDRNGVELPPVDLHIRDGQQIYTIDAAITCSSRSAYVEVASTKAGSASDATIRIKKRRDRITDSAIDIKRKYFIVETTGFINKEALSIIDEAARMHRLPHDPALVAARKLLLQEIGIIIWRGNAFAARHGRQQLKFVSTEPTSAEETDDSASSSDFAGGGR